MEDTKKTVIVICGPTASGKTGLSIEVAKKIDGEIISADSMQIYKTMNIGTAKVTKEEMQEIPHYMIDFLEPDMRYSVAEFKQSAQEKIDEILKKGKVPIIVGGTGLYVNSLIYNIKYNDIIINEDYREELEKIADEQGLEVLYKKALKIDEEAMKTISKNDRKRIIRVLEIYKQTGKTKTKLEVESRKEAPKYNFKIFGINIDRSILYDRINRRVDIMMNCGLIQEVENILKKYSKFPTAMQGLGYKEVVSFLKGEYTKEEMVEKLKMETRRYAKRQITWFKRIENIIWINGSAKMQDNIDVILEEVNEGKAK